MTTDTTFAQLFGKREKHPTTAIWDAAWKAWQAATAAERERCAKVCDAVCDDQWAKYKGLPPHVGHPARGNTYTEGVSDGAGMCADKIRSGND